jgi:hypothetical protein
MCTPHLVPAPATIVTLDISLAADQSVTLEAPTRKGQGAPKGHEVEEVEDPPVSLIRGGSVTLRLTAPTHAYAYARTRVRA